MKIAFDLGKAEKHYVVFSFNQIFGSIEIQVDGIQIINKTEFFSHQLVKTFMFDVGTKEIHSVRIVKERKLILAGFRKHKYRIFVDEELVEERVGY